MVSPLRYCGQIENNFNHFFECRKYTNLRHDLLQTLSHMLGLLPFKLFYLANDLLHRTITTSYLFQHTGTCKPRNAPGTDSNWDIYIWYTLECIDNWDLVYLLLDEFRYPHHSVPQHKRLSNNLFRQFDVFNWIIRVYFVVSCCVFRFW